MGPSYEGAATNAEVLFTYLLFHVVDISDAVYWMWNLYSKEIGTFCRILFGSFDPRDSIVSQIRNLVQLFWDVLESFFYLIDPCFFCFSIGDFGNS